MAKTKNKHKKKSTNHKNQVNKASNKTYAEQSLSKQYNKNVAELTRIKKEHPEAYKKAVMILIATTLAIVLAIAAIVIGVAKLSGNRNSTLEVETEQIIDEQGLRVDIDEASALVVDASSIRDDTTGIVLNIDVIDTSAYEYNQMILECNALIESDPEYKLEESEINTNLSLDIDKLHVDSIEETTEIKSNEKSILYNTNIDEKINNVNWVDSTGYIGHTNLNIDNNVILFYESMLDGKVTYFDNMVIKRFVSTTGKFKVACAVLTEEGIEVFSQNILDESAIASINHDEFRLPSSNEMSDKEYIAAIYDCISYMMISGDTTVTGYNTIISDYIAESGIIEALKLRDFYNSNITNTYLKYGKIGMSSYENDSVDRVYLQIQVETCDEDGNVTTDILNMILKMDSSNRIFNIDTI